MGLLWRDAIKIKLYQLENATIKVIIIRIKQFWVISWFLSASVTLWMPCMPGWNTNKYLYCIHLHLYTPFMLLFLPRF